MIDGGGGDPMAGAVHHSPVSKRLVIRAQRPGWVSINQAAVIGNSAQASRTNPQNCQLDLLYIDGALGGFRCRVFVPGDRALDRKEDEAQCFELAADIAFDVITIGTAAGGIVVVLLVDLADDAVGRVDGTGKAQASRQDGVAVVLAAIRGGQLNDCLGGFRQLGLVRDEREKIARLRLRGQVVGRAQRSNDVAGGFEGGALGVTEQGSICEAGEGEFEVGEVHGGLR